MFFDAFGFPFSEIPPTPPKLPISYSGYNSEVNETAASKRKRKQKAAFRNPLYWHGAEIRGWEERGARRWGDRDVAFRDNRGGGDVSYRGF